MALTAPRQRRRSIVASAVRIPANPSEAQDPMVVRTRLPWQERAFAYYDLIGEIWYAAQFYARALSRLELTLVRDAGSDDEEVVDDAALTEYITRIQDPGGGQANLLGTYGRLMFLTGECYLVVQDAGKQTEAWEMLSCDELRMTKAGEYQRFKLPNTRGEQIDATDDKNWEPVSGAIVYRFWTRHPRYSALADGPMRGVLDLCEELLILTRAVRARGRSRLAGAGILLMPEEMSFSPDEPGGDEDPKHDPFIDDLTNAMVAGISDEGTAAAVVPLIVRGAAEYIDKVTHLQIHDPMQTYPETGLRMECIQRIAMGLDMPPEILLGKADANHWSAWQIDEDTYKAHIEPVAQRMVDDFTGGYLRPSMLASGVADAASYSIGFDASALVVAPDRTADAMQLHDRLAISDDTLRETAGFDDDDAPDEEEWVRRAGVKMNNAQLAVTGTEEEGELAPPPNPSGGGAGQEEEPSRATPGGVEKAPPAGGADEEGGDEAVAAAVEVPSAMRLASELIEERAREAAGARLRTKYTRYRRQLDGVPNRDVARVLAPLLNGELEELEAERHNLVAGAGDCFRPRLRAWGLSEADVEMVVMMAESSAAEALFT